MDSPGQRTELRQLTLTDNLYHSKIACGLTTESTKFLPFSRRSRNKSQAPTFNDRNNVKGHFGPMKQVSGLHLENRRDLVACGMAFALIPAGSHFKISDHVRGQGAGRRKSGAYMIVCESRQRREAVRQSRQRRDHRALAGVLKWLLTASGERQWKDVGCINLRCVLGYYRPMSAIAG
jgi:hypothetical protein